MDKSQLTGIALLGCLLLTYILFFNNDPEIVEGDITKDSISAIVTNDTIATDSTGGMPVVSLDSSALSKFGPFASGMMKKQEEEIVLENDDVKVVLTTAGAKVKKVFLKKHKTYTDFIEGKESSLELIDGANHQLKKVIKTNYGKKGELDLHALNYSANKSDSSVVFTMSDASGNHIQHIYSLSASGYQLSYKLNNKGFDNFINSDEVQLVWKYQPKLLEKNLEQSRMTSTVNYYTSEGDFEDFAENVTDYTEEKVETSVKWVAMKQHFFNAAIIAKNPLKNVLVASSGNSLDSLTLRTNVINATTSFSDLNDEKAIVYYFGPNDIDICKGVTQDFEKNIKMGWTIISVINKWTIRPIFKFLEGFTSNYGLIILLVVLLVKSVLLPLVYKSFKSMAKMKTLKPEIDAITEKYGDDATGKQQATMKLYSEMGVSPLSGCIPMVVQMPVLLSMFYFFPNIIELRQQSFLWAEDLSVYDSLISFGMAVPLLGDHLSLFTVLMTISSIGYAYVNNQMTPSSMSSQPGGMNMQYIGYFMPVVFLFVLNNYAAGLCYYYLVSNIYTIAQQSVIKKFFIDNDKLRSELDANKLKYQKKAKSGKLSFKDRLLEERKKGSEKGAKK